ncbi:MAG: TetR/AcrR family transcriptional regulator [Anaerostipes sp.]|nr:TetR/AcrR family transcriptional regulator [Anaerostipes sp.]
MRIVKNPDERKQEILDAAVRVFAKKGYEKTSITDIANEIGVSQGLCYRYYASKEEMYDAAVDEYASYIVNQNIQRTNTAGLTLKEQIVQLSGRMEEYTSAEHGENNLYELFHKKENHKMHDALFLRTCEKLIPYFTSKLEEAARRGEITVADPKASAYFMIFGQMGVLMSKDYSEEEKAMKIQKCLFEMFGIK